MNAATYHNHAAPIKGYAQHMSIKAAIAKQKRNHLNRLNFQIDDVVKVMRQRGEIQ